MKSGVGKLVARIFATVGCVSAVYMWFSFIVLTITQMDNLELSKYVDVVLMFNSEDISIFKSQLLSLFPHRDHFNNVYVVTKCKNYNNNRNFYRNLDEEWFEFVCSNAENVNERLNEIVIVKVQSDFFLYVDDNTRVEQFDFVQSVRIFFESTKISVIGGKIIYNEKIISSGKALSFVESKESRFEFYDIFEGFREYYRSPISFLLSTEKSGTLFRREDFLELGGFDREFGIIDYCLRVQFELEKEITYLHDNWMGVFIVDEYYDQRIDYNALERKWEQFLMDSRFLDSKYQLVNRIAWDFGGGSCSGWFIEATNFVTYLQNDIQDLRIITGKDDFCQGLPKYVSKSLIRLIDRQFHNISIWISHKPPDRYPDFQKFGGYYGVQTVPGIPKYVIGRSMYETTKIPNEWIDKINELVDEVWVPSTFVKDYFLNSGVPKEKVVYIPETLDPFFYDPDVVSPIEDEYINSKKGKFNFFSVFKWEERKGFEFLIEAYVKEFSKKKDETTLFILTYHPQYKEAEWGRKYIYSDINAIIDRLVDEDVVEREDIPNIEILCSDEPFPTTAMPSLYKTMDAFVLPTRGEGFGLPIFEAMLMRLPTIVTGFSGHLDFSNEKTSFLIDVESLEPVNTDFQDRFGRLFQKDEENDDVFASWARPSVDHLQNLMRIVMEDRELALQKGHRARRFIMKNFSPQVVTGMILDRLENITKKIEDGSSFAGDEL